METSDLPSGNTHYVDNVRFQQLLVERKAQFDESGVAPRVTDELGHIILQIAENLSYRRNFINYSFREEMVGDGIENCLKYIDNYDPVNYSNPFAYFTQTCFFAFVRRINREEKQKDVKGAVYEQQAIDEDLHDNWEFQHAVVDSYVRE